MLSHNPKPSIKRLLIGDCVARLDKSTKASIIKERYSGGPKAKAILPNIGAKTCKPRIPIVPAKKDPIATIAKAAPALPFLAFTAIVDRQPAH